MAVGQGPGGRDPASVERTPGHATVHVGGTHGSPMGNTETDANSAGNKG